MLAEIPVLSLFLLHAFCEKVVDFLRKVGENERKVGLMVKCTPERGHNALFFIPLEVIIML